MNIKHAFAQMRQDIRSAGKSGETEGIWDRAVTNPLGYLLARFFIHIGWTPHMAAFLSMCVGAGGGVLFLSDFTILNITGALLVIAATVINSADAQMASLTGNRSVMGRMLHNSCRNVWYTAIYIALGVRLFDHKIPFSDDQWGGLIWVVIAAVALLGHAPQRIMAERYKKAHNAVAGHGSFETSKSIFAQRSALPANARFRRMCLWFRALRYRIHEAISPDTAKLFKAFDKAGISDEVREDYLSRSRKVLPLASLLGFNLRAYTLFICAVANVPLIALAIELIALDAVLFCVKGRYEAAARDVLYGHRLPGSETPWKKPNYWTAVFFGLGIAGVVTTLSNTDLSAVNWKGDVLGKIAVWLPSIMGVWLLIYILHTIAYAVIIGSDWKKINPLRLFKMVIAGFALNNVTPVGFAGGEPYRIMELKGSIGTEKATASAFTFTIMNTVFNFALWVAGALMYFVTGCKGGIGMCFAALAVLGVFGYILFLFFRSKGDSFVTGALTGLSKLPLAGRYFTKLLSEKRESLEQIDREMGAFRTRKRDFIITGVIEFATRILEVSEIYILLRVLGADVSFVYAVFSFAAASVFGNLIFFIPMQIGAREASFALTLGWAGVASSIAVTASLLCRIRDISYLILGVGLMLMKPQDEESAESSAAAPAETQKEACSEASAEVQAEETTES